MTRTRTSTPRPARAGAHAGRALGRAGSALALAASLALAGPPGALAVDEITTQEYVGPLGVANEVAAGYTGAGVTIAFIDGPTDTTVPELAGADITVKPMCDFTAPQQPHARHHDRVHPGRPRLRRRPGRAHPQLLHPETGRRLRGRLQVRGRG